VHDKFAIIGLSHALHPCACLQIPAYYTLLVRSLSVLEGIALASDPQYKVLGAAYPWVARR
jgi:predicted unusual protein kinase regulating ubiquinone biosynthesis (AarF/ABC1/UbiB family)